jgi:hypothetical protein
MYSRFPHIVARLPPLSSQAPAGPRYDRPQESAMSCFDRVHDVIVHGAGFAGFAAVRRLRAAGVDALLLDRGPALLWEAGWAFADDAGGCDAPEWAAWCAHLAARGAYAAGRLDCGSVEAEAATLLRAEGVPVLLYAAPLAAELDGGRLAAIAVATKSGVRRLAARRWIDASDAGELARLCGAAAFAAPSRQRVHIVLRRRDWTAGLPSTLACPELPGAAISVESTHWANERRLAIELPGAYAVDSALWLPVLGAARAAWSDRLAKAIVTHGSVQALPCWEAASPACGLPANLVVASPALAGGGWQLGARFALGLQAAEALRDLPAATPTALGPVPRTVIVAEAVADFAVIGAGTGGALAALAGARAGLRTIACDPMPFVGGTGTGGGIHSYYWGVRGGLQEEVDGRVRAATALFGEQRQVSGFHPEAKKAVLATMLREAGVDVRYGMQLAEIAKDGRRVASAVLAGPGGAQRLSARTWADGTGDGDLCALAGAGFRSGRSGDGLRHAFTQSCGRAHVNKDGDPAIHQVNFDAGYCDPADAEDLSRARLLGSSWLVQERYETDARPHGLSPVLGLRQGRQIETETTVTLDDQVMGRRFADGIGASGSNYDNHARDFEFESLQAAFWVWACRNWRQRTWHELPYGCIVPRDLDNCWIVSRCLGVTEEAHHSLRMQRDMQRIGEAAALAAAASLAQGCPARAIDLAPVRRGLEATGAMQSAAEDTDDVYGRERGRLPEEDEPDLSGERAGLAMWRRYRRGAAAVPGLLPMLDDARPEVSWRAAAVLGALGDARAEPRLLAALSAREDAPHRGDTRNVVPLWLAGLAMLKACAGPTALPVLAALLADADPGFHVRTLVAQVVAGIAGRHRLDAPQRSMALTLVDRIEAMQQGAAILDPNAPIDAPLSDQRPATDRRAVRYDATWQLRLVLGQARQALQQGLAARA